MLLHRLARLLVALALLVAAAGCGLFGDRGPDAAVGAFLTAWSAGDDRGAAALTDDPPAATELLVATREALGAPAVDRRAGAGADGDRSGRRVGRR